MEKATAACVGGEASVRWVRQHGFADSARRQSGHVVAAAFVLLCLVAPNRAVHLPPTQVSLDAVVSLYSALTSSGMRSGVGSEGGYPAIDEVFDFDGAWRKASEKGKNIDRFNAQEMEAWAAKEEELVSVKRDVVYYEHVHRENRLVYLAAACMVSVVFMIGGVLPLAVVPSRGAKCHRKA
eukprot:TRINITY_DN42480_c0_g1_i1.p1 TRINITY_DN42480_c0_g1~~TRINITY_DN42480_c0_g1_i1.p1  ORF type:complete len:181 (+),score=38.38 TRINITY_DN42480_c0_g1_i1:121-663(+)